MNAQSFQGGFATPATDAAAAFRAIMEAMACPGSIRGVMGASPPSGLSIAAGVAVLTLCDQDTGICLKGVADSPEVRGWIAFHTGASVVGAGLCDFAIGTWDALLPLDPYRIGTSEYPDRSATLIVEVDALLAEGATLSGPGIRDTSQLSLPDLTVFQRNSRQYPLGLDFIFTRGAHLAALPRSTQVS